MTNVFSLARGRAGHCTYAQHCRVPSGLANLWYSALELLYAERSQSVVKQNNLNRVSSSSAQGTYVEGTLRRAPCLAVRRAQVLLYEYEWQAIRRRAFEEERSKSSVILLLSAPGSHVPGLPSARVLAHADS